MIFFSPVERLRKGGRGVRISLEGDYLEDTSRGGRKEKMRQTSGDRASRMRVNSSECDPRVIKRGFERGCGSELLPCL